MYSPVPGPTPGPGLPPLSPVAPNHWLQAWLVSEGHRAWTGQLRLVLQWLLDTEATIMGDERESSARHEETLPKSHPRASSWVFHCSTSSPFSGWS